MLDTVFNSLFQLVLVIPFVFIASKGNKNPDKNILIAAVLMFLVTSVVNDLLSTVSLFPGQQWNWAGKIASFLIAAIFIYTYKSVKPKQFGFTKKIEWQGAKPILVICTVYFLLRLVLYLTSSGKSGSFHGETFLFQATVPGIAEETIFRGILLTLLNRVFIKPKWSIANVQFGWAAIITSILFGLTHGVSLDSHFNIYFDTFNLARTAFDGFLFALLIEKTKSLVPGILFHNLLNLIGNH